MQIILAIAITWLIIAFFGLLVRLHMLCILKRAYELSEDKHEPK